MEQQWTLGDFHKIHLDYWFISFLKKIIFSQKSLSEFKKGEAILDMLHVFY